MNGPGCAKQGAKEVWLTCFFFLFSPTLTASRIGNDYFIASGAEATDTEYALLHVHNMASASHLMIGQGYVAKDVNLKSKSYRHSAILCLKSG